MRLYLALALALAAACLVLVNSQDADECPADHCEGPKGALGARGRRGSVGQKGDRGKIGVPGRFPQWFHWHNRKGQKGEPGTPGTDGIRGRTGPKGAKGGQGDAGEDGSPGAAGDTGDAGRDGVVGAKGDRGTKGNTGPAGERGFQGMTGDRGARGERGNRGEDGRNGVGGAKGDRGARGRDGQPGADGIGGAAGDSGDRGPRGTSGSSGQIGNKGDAGTPGTKGNLGDRGLEGSKGTKGFKGEPGHKIMTIDKNQDLCTADLEGEIRYSASGQDIYFCDGDQWMCVSSRPCSGVQCIRPDGTRMSEGEVYFNATSSQQQLKEYACVVTLIDESGTMSGEHAWVQNAITELEKLLVARSIGAGAKTNVYAIVGFGVPDVSARSVTLNGNTWFGADRFGAAASQLQTDGDTEDGYYAVKFALDTLTIPEDCARNFILITDERRAESPQGASLTYADTLKLLRDNDITMNVIANIGFEVIDQDGFDNDAFGVDYQGDAFIVARGGNFIEVKGGVPSVSEDMAFCNSFRDYGELGLRTSGAVWDLETLREGDTNPLYADAFTKAFTEVKSVEIFTTLRACRRCVCQDDGTGEGEIVCTPHSDVAFCTCRASGKTADECRAGDGPTTVFDPTSLTAADCSTLG